MPVTIDKLLGKPLSHTHQASDIIGLPAGGSDSTSVVTVSSNTTLSTNATALVDASAGSVTIFLPAAAANANKMYRIKKIDSSANTVTIDANGAETIDDATTVTIAFQYSTMDIVSNGTSWYII